MKTPLFIPGTCQTNLTNILIIDCCHLPEIKIVPLGTSCIEDDCRRAKEPSPPVTGLLDHCVPLGVSSTKSGLLRFLDDVLRTWKARDKGWELLQMNESFYYTNSREYKIASDDPGTNGYTPIYRVIIAPHRNILDATTYFFIQDYSRIIYLNIYMYPWFYKIKISLWCPREF